MVVFVIGCKGAVITMVSIWLNIPNVSSYNGGTGVLLFFRGLLAGVLAFSLFRLGSFFLYGYGELIDSCQSVAVKTVAIFYSAHYAEKESKAVFEYISGLHFIRGAVFLSY